MTTSKESLGGRLFLLKPSELTSTQKAFYNHIRDTEISWATKSGFQAETNAHEFIGPFNSMLRSPEIATALMGLTTALTSYSALSETVRQVVILTVGAVWQADYELYAHTAVAKKAGLQDEAIESLAAGQLNDSLSKEEKLAQIFTHHLATSHQIPLYIYEEAIQAFGEKGIFDLIVLAGQYMTISSLLNAFKVPAPDKTDQVSDAKSGKVHTKLTNFLADKKARFSRRGEFWIPGERKNIAGKTYQHGPMFVGWEAPAQTTEPYPIILVHGGALQGTEWLDTPDGRPGWAQRFVEAGYTVFVVDRPGHGRSPFQTDVMGAMGPSFYYEEGKEVFFPDSTVANHTQWPFDPKNAAALDAFIAPFGPLPADLAASQQMDADRLADLLDRIGPAIIITHSASGSDGWLVTDRRPNLVVAIVTVEPMGPVFADVPNIGALAWGLTAAPITYDPPRVSAEDVRGADPSSLKIPALAGIPVAIVSGEVSVQAKYAPAITDFLKTAGADAELLHLPDYNIRGNGHGLIYENNSDQALEPVLQWLAEKTNTFQKEKHIMKDDKKSTMFVTYTGDADTRFDKQYYLDHHMPLVLEAWSPYGLTNATALFEAGTNPGVIAVCVCEFRNEGSIDAALNAQVTEKVMADVKHFTDVEPKQSRIKPS